MPRGPAPAPARPHLTSTVHLPEEPRLRWRGGGGGRAGTSPRPQLVGGSPPPPPRDGSRLSELGGHVLGRPSQRPVPSLPPAVESLRQLMLWRLLPGHTTEPLAAGAPEDDLTPTASASVASHPWDPGSPGRAPTGGEGDSTQLPGPEGAAATCSLEHLPPRTRHSGIWEPPELDSAPEEEASGSEAASSYQVVRKGKTNGGRPASATPLARAGGCFPPPAPEPRRGPRVPGRGACGRPTRASGLDSRGTRACVTSAQTRSRR